jgi:hypothetical protein
MPFAGTFDPAIPSEQKAFSIDFVNDLAAGDSIVSATATVAVFYGQDVNVAQLVIPPPAINGTIVTQVLGLGPGFQPGTIYRWTVTALTQGGWTLISYAHLPCNAVA